MIVSDHHIPALTAVPAELEVLSRFYCCVKRFASPLGPGFERSKNDYFDC